MNLEFNANEAVQRFQKTMDEVAVINNGNLSKKIAADWLAKEIEFLMLKAAVTENGGHREALQTIVNWTLGDHVARWHDPLMHKTIMKEVETRSEVQRFISGRLPLLVSMNHEFHRPYEKTNSSLLQILQHMQVFPLVITSADYQSLPQPLIEASMIDDNYLETFFFQHHWLLMLLFCLSSFQYYGYDQALLIQAN